MKKLLLMACMVLASTAMFAQKGTGHLGVNLNYGFDKDINNYGVGVKAQYELLENLRAEAAGDLYFKKDNVTMWDVNLGLQYLIGVGEKLRVYPMAGVSLLGFSYGSTGLDNESDLGFFAGGGAEYPISDQIKANVEVKYQHVKDVNRAIVSFGLAYKL